MTRMDCESSNELIEDLYQEYADDVFRMALLSTHRNYAEAEDIVQEVFLRVVQYFPTFRGDAQAKTWIWRIAKNCITDAARKRMKRFSVQQALGYESSVSLIETTMELEDMLRFLPHRDRQLLNLRIIRDMSVAQTAQVLQCSEGKVRIDTHRALRRLRQSPQSAIS